MGELSRIFRIKTPKKIEYKPLFTIADEMNKLRKSKLRVLFVGSFFDTSIKPERGGQHASCETLVNSPIQSEVDFIQFDTTNTSVPPPPLWQRFLQTPRRIGHFGRILASEKPHLTLIYSSGGFSFFEKVVMTIASRLLGIPVILSVRAGAFQDSFRSSAGFRAVARPFLRTPSVILCQSESWARFYAEEAGIARTRLEVVHNWINLERFVPRGQMEERNSDKPIRLLFVGWVNRSKGIFELLTAVGEVAATCPVTLDIVGKGNEYDEAVSMVENDPVLRRQVRFYGWLSGDDVLTRYGEADVFVLPTYAEGFPNAVLEAMTMALPIITTPVGGIPDVVEDGRNGLLVPPGSSYALALAIRYMAEHPDTRLSIGRANRAQVVADHGILVLWPRMLSIFRRLTDSSASRFKS
jgi:glycosyltransferase involved in cell wall biosynthesis